HTTYPWYTNIQPIGLWMQWHVNDGKKELNFSEFKTNTPKRQKHKFEEISEVIEEDEMPLWSYTLIHSETKLSVEQKTILTNWAKQSFDKMAVQVRVRIGKSFFYRHGCNSLRPNEALQRSTALSSRSAYLASLKLIPEV
ncbi:MAG: heme-binding domain-containing protein, partial [Bdellovibrionaceae bacterium]|nr:heme-binding domain-containing protein [Pseudobdellovibrionaceae bacterium]